LSLTADICPPLKHWGCPKTCDSLYVELLFVSVNGLMPYKVLQCSCLLSDSVTLIHDKNIINFQVLVMKVLL